MTRLHLFGLLVALLPLSAFAAANMSISQAQPLRQLDLKPFNQIFISGNFTVHIKEGQAQQVDVEQRGKVDATVENHTLWLKAPSSFWHHSNMANVTIHLPQLQAFTSRDGARVIIHKHKNNPLNVRAENSGKLLIDGHPNVHWLLTSGNSQVTIKDVRSTHLDIHAHDNSRIQLSGISGVTHITLNQQSTLDAHTMVSRTMDIKTSDQSQANVNVSHNLYALAFRGSHIFYYQQPKFIATKMFGTGSIIGMSKTALTYPISWHNSQV